MQKNEAYGQLSSALNNDYAIVQVVQQSQSVQTDPAGPALSDSVHVTKKGKSRSTCQQKPLLWGFSCFTMAIAVIALIIVSAVAAVILATRSNSDVDSDIQILRMQLISQQEKLTSIQKTLLGLTYATPASTCKDVPPHQSGKYWIQANSNTSPVRVYCDMTQRNCSCNTTGGWMRVAHLDMTDPDHQCPGGFRQVNRSEPPLRTCGRPGPVGCVSTTFPAHGIEYLHVCGRVVGYQYATPDAFYSYHTGRTTTIGSPYVGGVSITHGHSPRQHIWTFAAALDEIQSEEPQLGERTADARSCPCMKPNTPFLGTLPPFIDQDYFCDTGSRDQYEYRFYPDDPLWDGQGCGGNSTCCEFNNPPWFCKQLPQPTTDDIELRLCDDQNTSDEDTPIERVEIYIN